MLLARRVSLKYRDADEKADHRGGMTMLGGGSVDRREKLPSGDGGKDKDLGSAIPTQLANFQAKAIITSKNTQMTSHVLFHAFKDIIAVSDGIGVDIWSHKNGARLTSIDRQSVINSHLSSTYGGHSMEKKNIVTWSSLSRISSLSWLNMSSDSLILTGADDGTIQLWRDNVDESAIDDIADNEGHSPANMPHTSSAQAAAAAGSESPSPTLAAAFTALPDIAPTSRGSGLIVDWQQHSGILAAGGNSETIRLWDVSREQCTRVLYTGMKQCTSAISCQSVSWKNIGGFGQNGAESTDFGKLAQSFGRDGERDQPSAYWSWIFAGFGDGSVGVFDQRIPTAGGKVHSAKEDGHWIVHTAVREDIPEVFFCIYLLDICGAYFTLIAVVGLDWGSLWRC